jgi:hypothetical protein
MDTWSLLDPKPPGDSAFYSFASVQDQFSIKGTAGSRVTTECGQERK